MTNRVVDRSQYKTGLGCDPVIVIYTLGACISRAGINEWIVTLLYSLRRLRLRCDD